MEKSHKVIKCMSSFFLVLILLLFVRSSMAFAPGFVDIIEETIPDENGRPGAVLQRLLPLLDKEFTYTYEPLPSSVKTVDGAVSAIIAQMRRKGITGEYDKALYLHDWLVMNAYYDFHYQNYYPDGVLLKGKGVCQSYAMAYQLLLNAAGITNVLVSAPEMNHAWNIVKINGVWCHVDVTWDDPLTYTTDKVSGYERHEYFGLNDEMMSRDHKWSRGAYPKCTKLDNYYYYNDDDFIIVKSSAEMVSALNKAAAARQENIVVMYIGDDPSFEIDDVFNDWFYSSDWKYGMKINNYLTWITSEGIRYKIECKLEYGEPWAEPAAKIRIVDMDDQSRLIDLATAGTANEKLTYQLAVETENLDENQSVHWWSDNRSVAEVDDNGLVTGKKDGSTSIVAVLWYQHQNSSEMKQIRARVRIKVVTGLNPKYISISGGDSVAVGKTVTLKANVAWPANKPSKTGIVWRSSDSSVATVTSGGVVKGIKDGKVTINACFAADRSLCKGHDMVVKAQGQSVVIVDKDNGKKSIDLGTKGTGDEKLTYQLGANVLPAEASQAVTWQSKTPAVATVDGKGLVTAVKAGTATITAATTDGTKKSASIKITIGVMPQPGSLKISGGNEVAEKKTLKLTVVFDQKVQPTNAKVTWTSKNPNIAKVSNKGVVTGVAGTTGGQAVIEACAAADSTVCAKHTVKVVPLVKSVTILDVENNGFVIDLDSSKTTYQLNASTQPSDASKAVNWKSSSTAIADVNESGLVMAKKAGTVTITATAADGSKKSDKIKINIGVMPKAGSLVISGGNEVAEKKTLKLTYYFNQKTQPTNKKVTWTSSDVKIAKVSNAGVVTGTGGGTAIITVCSAADSRVCAKHTVRVLPIVKAVKITDKENKGLVIDVAAGMKTYRLSASTEPSGASQTVTWKSSSPAIATVDEDGTVTAKKAGTVTITAKATDGSKKTASIKLTVKAKVQPGSLVINGGNKVDVKKKLTLKAAFTQQIQPTVSKIVWSSSNVKVAKVSNKGVVTGVSAGQAVIRAAAKDDATVYAEVKVIVGTYSAKSDLLEPETDPVSDKSVLMETGVDMVGVLAENDQDENMQTVPESTETSENEPAGEGNAAEPHFDREEAWLLVGESLILDVVNPDNVPVMVGLSGSTDSVLWNSDSYLLTTVGEAEVTAFLTSMETADVKDMMAIHIVSEIPEVEEVSEEMGEAEGLIREETEEDIVGLNNSIDDVEGSVLFETGETAEETDAAADNLPDEGKNPSEGIEPSDEEMNAGTVEEDQFVEVSEETESEPDQSNPIKISIRDLGEYDYLNGEENSVISISRDRFELPDNVFSGLMFGIEDESVAKLTEQSVGAGVEIQLLNAGETKLVIKEKDSGEVLREIRLVVTAASVEEEHVVMELPVEDVLTESEETAGFFEMTVEEESVLVETDAALVFSNLSAGE